jgi:hypothetical protein
MQYKTIILELLQQRTAMYEQLRKERKLLSTMTLLATELRTRHQAWTEILSQADQVSDRSQVSSEALELAVRDITEDYLPRASEGTEVEVLSLDQAMAYLRNPTSRG